MKGHSTKLELKKKRNGDQQQIELKTGECFHGFHTERIDYKLGSQQVDKHNRTKT